MVTVAATGKGLRFVDLYVYTSTNAYEFDTVTSAFTNDFGEYELTGLSTGIYYVRARPDFAIRGQNFLDEYYNNKYW